jgi:2,4-dienoyl-CoA reductase (NADPH2)
MIGKTRFEKLLEPGHIGSVKTRNRIIKTGAGLLIWRENDLHMRDEVKAFYEGIARGGVGLLIVEAPTIDYPLGVRWRRRYRIDDDKYIEGLSELVKVIHKHNCPTFMQMNHDGPWQVNMPFEPKPLFSGVPVASSPVMIKSEYDHHNEMPRELTITEIEEIVDKFASAAVRAEKAGFDGVDVNAASSHLLHNFLSPFWNRRSDAYGGSLENRARFVTDIIREIKKRLGKNFPVSVIINGIEIGQAAGIADDKCLTPEISRGVAGLLEEAGADAIQVRNHWIGYHVGGFLPNLLFYPEPPIPLKSFPKEYYSGRKGAGANMLLAAGIKKVVSIPVTVVGQIDAELGENILKNGMADFIGMTRRLQADPELPNKISSGRIKDVAPCLGCSYCLGSRGKCRVNALMGTQYNTIDKAKEKKKVLVIGGGPAGMESARVSALRGHDVTLIEKSNKLGGLLPLAAVIKGSHPEDALSLINYLKYQITELGVKVELGKEGSLSVVESYKPDIVLIATGGINTTMQIPGIQRANVVSVPELHRMLKFYLRLLSPKTIRWLSNFYMPIGKRVVIIGGSIQGLELGEFLTKRGKKVTIVDQAEAMGEGMTNTMKEYLLMWFQKKGVSMITGVKEYKEITTEGLTIINKEGKRQTIKADSIVPVSKQAPNIKLLKSLEGVGPEVYAIGDCTGTFLIADAIHAGLVTARSI